ncbi:GntR family transcriptional regulator [Edaphobacter aggregans]|uniref:GntR family transcriptional regulator n=1 Tax=Edaphobacter aggregans TaxID=570835 RepID=A0A428MPC8_9BACT|nr:GntR family transcriptional regulator [Edaphobacter aggregans]
MRNSTRVIPFRLTNRPGIPIYEQVVYAATRAIVAGQLSEGDPFPSVRTLSRELHINPNTAHKVIAQLIDDGLLESRPGIGTVVASFRTATARERTELLNRQIEELVVEAKRLSIELNEVTSAISRHWKRLSTLSQEVSK